MRKNPYLYFLRFKSLRINFSIRAPIVGNKSELFSVYMVNLRMASWLGLSSDSSFGYTLLMMTLYCLLSLHTLPIVLLKYIYLMMMNCVVWRIFFFFAKLFSLVKVVVSFSPLDLPVGRREVFSVTSQSSITDVKLAIFTATQHKGKQTENGINININTNNTNNHCTHCTTSHTGWRGHWIWGSSAPSPTRSQHMVELHTT